MHKINFLKKNTLKKPQNSHDTTMTQCPFYMCFILLSLYSGCICPPQDTTFSDFCLPFITVLCHSMLAHLPVQLNTIWVLTE